MNPKEQLALNGGPKTRNNPFPSLIRYGQAETDALRDVVESGNMSYWSKNKCIEFAKKAKKFFGSQYCAGGSSGSAVIHAAIGALEIPPGYEVITSSITDMGTLIGILYQNLIPVFADVDPYSYNLTADTIRQVITDRTRAIIPVHLAGNPCEMDEIMELAAEYGIPVIEDCAQAYNAIYKNRIAGSIGNIGCFSLNESKHISSGDGGFAITDNEELFFGIHNYLDKYYDRFGRGVRMDRLAPCYRLSELQYAVASVQLDKVKSLTAIRNSHGKLLTALIGGNDCLFPQQVAEHSRSSYWFYMFRLNPEKLYCTPEQFVEALRAEGIACSKGYLPRPLYLEKMFTEKNFFPGGIWPAEVVSSREYSYYQGLCPNAEKILTDSVRLTLNEAFSTDDIKDIAEAVNKVCAAFTGEINCD
jgi:perosamine synthetase